MITKDITIAGKLVTIGYCYAAEIAYKELAGEEFADYAAHAVDCIQRQRDPDVKNTVFAVVACATAYYQSKGQDAPIGSGDIMNDAKPAEFGMAILAVLGLRAQFYHVHGGGQDGEDDTASGEEKKKG